MAKDVITINGENLVVREDTAKSYRGVIWGLTTAAVFLAIMAVLFISFFWKSASDGNLESPAQIENSSRR